MTSNTKPSFTPPRGMRDITPEEMAKRRYVCARIQEVLDLYGYNLVDPTHVEKLETIFAKAGPAIENEIYAFEDKGGRRLGLRFDLTVGIARMVATNPQWPKPLRIAAVSNIWRYDEPQYGRYRSVYQWDVEIFGSNKPAADAEVVEVSCKIMDRLGLDDYEILVNDRQIVDRFLESIGLKEKRPDVLRVMDKRGKITEGEMIQQFKALSVDDSQIERIVEFSSMRGSIQEISDFLRRDLEMGDLDAVPRMEEIGGILQASIGLDRIIFDLSLVRGLDYYTGFVFECFDPQNVELGSVFGGGRFDRLVGIYGRDCPAVGCAGGITRLILALESKGLLPKELLPVPSVLVIPVTQRESAGAAALASRLREAGVPSVVEIMGRKLRKSLENANRLGYEYAVIVGSRDLEKGLVTVRDMGSGKESLVRVEDVAGSISGRKTDSPHTEG